MMVGAMGSLLDKNNLLNIGLYYTNSSHRGPGKVVTNLLKGFAELDEDIQVIPNPDRRSIYEHNIKLFGVLQPLSKPELYSVIPDEAIMGPNLFVVPSEMDWLVNRSNKHYVVPTQWVKNVYQEYGSMKNKEIHIWSVGIDSGYWKPYSEFSEDEQTEALFSTGSEFIDCFVYYKNRSAKDLNAVLSLLRKKNLKYEVIEYGKYHENELKSLCYRSKFCIVLDNTESQGIALMEIMSTDTPCYVFDFPKWYAPDTNKKYDATSVPYFSEELCGHIATGLSEQDLDWFIGNLSSYNPRKYIIENHSLATSSQKYLNLLKLSSGR